MELILGHHSSRSFICSLSRLKIPPMTANKLTPSDLSIALVHDQNF